MGCGKGVVNIIMVLQKYMPGKRKYYFKASSKYIHEALEKTRSKK
jgi:hypothetical protein